ncbi:MBL fold metallo-hydrolase [Lujinxingia litoralis]|uniref:MBL fold metallo-hydrolase n=1 Tax=Lujinxingia litoralis TaxID=2211119 RepID=A0A328C881_9DELT|nr:MBL fold metallo-hydrolase [Lujinxingia litoralis]RAL20788.1 MBL fold metallo-hydrolase [Lujinxingia litoralis]
MILERLYDSDLAQASFLIGCPDTQRALVVDPRRDLEPYLALARAQGLTITDVAETHIHADFLSGARELALATGATFWHSAQGGETWRYQGLSELRARPLQDGQHIRLGCCALEAVHTPGHTPEHLSYLLIEHDHVLGVLTGDFLFVSTLGRPDLIDATGLGENSSRQAAEALYRSVHIARERFPHDVPLWPGHGAGSACGKAIGALPSTTLAIEWNTAPWATYLKRDDKEGFIEHILAGQPDSPTYFKRMKVENRDGFGLRDRSAEPARLHPHRIRQAIDQGVTFVDLRSRDDFQRAHLPQSLHLPLGAHLESWAGWALPWRQPLVLIASPGEDPAQAATRLLRVGHDAIVGWARFDELPDAHFTDQPYIEVDEALERWRQKDALFVDVRSSLEWRQGHIPDALHRPFTRLTTLCDTIPDDQDLIVYCGSGARAAAATSLLHAHGLTRAIVFEGSMQTWTERALPLEPPAQRPAAP